MGPVTIEIIITPDGEIEGQVKDILGPDCEGLLSWLWHMGDVVEDHPTEDYFRVSPEWEETQRAGL